MRPTRRPSPHLLPGVALVLIALSVLVQVVLHPDLSRPWLSSPLPQSAPGALPTQALPQQQGAPADVLAEAAVTVRDAGAGHGAYAARYAAGELPHIGGGSGAGNTSAATCSGVTDLGGGAYAYSLLHVDSAGIVRDAGNCPVVLTGFDWEGTSSGGGNDGGPGLSMAQTDLVFATFHTQFGANIWRIYLNATWWTQDVAMPTPISPTYPTYRVWIAHLVNDAAANGGYALLVPDTIFQEGPALGTTGPHQDQGNCDYNGTGCTNPGPTAQYLANPYVCFDGAVITSTVQMIDSLASTYSVSPSVLFGTWNEMKDNQCGRTINEDPDQTGTGGRVVYQDNSGLVAGYTVPAADQPYWTTPTPFGAWYDHQSVLIDYIRHRDPTALVFVGGPGFSNSLCPLAGNPNTGDTAHCGGSGAPVSTGTQYPVLTHRFTQGNIVSDLHQYPPTGYMVSGVGTTYPTRIDNEAKSVQALGYGLTFGEMGGANPAADHLCYIFPPAASRTMGVLYHEPNNVTAAGNINGALTLSPLGNAVARDYAYLRGDAGAVTVPVETDNTTVCPASYADITSTFYIATSGSDANSCTLAQPCASLTHFGVAQGGPTVLPGATIDVLPGQYNLAYTGVTTPTNGTVGLWDWNGVAGTAAQPITIQGIGAVTITRETPATLWDQQVRLLSIRQQGGGAPQLPNYVTFANMTFVGMTARADYLPAAWHTLDPGGNTDGTPNGEIEYYVSISPVGDIFDHLTVRDSAIGCIKGQSGPTVQYSLLLNCGKGNFSHAVYANAGNWTLTHNVVINGAGASLYTDDSTAGHVMTITDNVVSQQAVSITIVGSAGIQTAEGGSIVARNVVYDGWCGAINIGHGLPNSIDAAHPITVEQNVVANWNVSQASNCTALSYAAPGYFTVRNNSFWGRGFYTSSNGTPNGPMIVENNIFAAGAAPNYACYVGYPTEDYNLFYNSVLNPVCSTTQGVHDINGGASTNPLFWAAPYVPPAAMNPFVPLPDLHLQAASPARGAGTNVGYGTDLGAYPYDVTYPGTSTPQPTSTPLPTPAPGTPSAGSGAQPSGHVGHRH